MNKKLEEKINLCKSKNLHISIHQPGYHRHLYYYFKMYVSDIFISLDVAQFVEREWQNRQVFYMNEKKHWLTVPVNNGREAIYKKKIVSPKVVNGHWTFISDIYKNAPYFHMYKEELKEIYNQDWQTLNDLCDALTGMVMKHLKIDTPYVRSSIYCKDIDNLHKANLLTACIKQLVNIDDYKNVIYLPRQKPIPESHYINHTFDNGCYTEKEKMEMSGVKVEGFSFSDPIYPQHQFPKGTEFRKNLSIFDLLFNCGKESEGIFKSSLHDAI